VKEPVPVVIVDPTNLGPRPSAQIPDNYIVSLGDRVYQIGTTKPITLTETEHVVLQAFLGSLPQFPPLQSMDKPELCRRSVEHAPRVLARLREKYDERFAPAIDTPEGKKASGGYSVRICRAATPK
jgi:hypothetical protein